MVDDIAGQTSKTEIIATAHSALIEMPIVEIDWLIDNVMRSGSIGLFGGKTASYKTWIGLELAYSVASGSEWLGTFKVKKAAGVLFIDEENGHVEILRRLRMLNRPGLPNLYFTDIQNIKLDNKDWLEGLGEYIKQHPDIKLVFVDTYRRVVSYDENDAGLVSEFINNLKQFIKTYNVAILFTHHFRKSANGKNQNDIEEYEEFRGSSDFVNSAESIFMVKNLHGEGSSITLRCLKLRQGQKFKDQVINITEQDGKLKIERVGEKEKTQSNREECAKKILAWMNVHFPVLSCKSLAIRDSMVALGFGKTTITEALQALVSSGELARPKQGFYKIGVGQGSLVGEEDDV